MESSLPPIDDLTEQSLMKYIENFLDIKQFKLIQNGKGLLDYLNEKPNHPKIKTVMRKVIGLFHTDSPSGKVCALQFIKEAMQTNSWTVVEAVEKSLLPQVQQILEYRSHIKSIQRGSSYFISLIDKNISEDEFTNLVRFSTTFFKMIHQCIYIWGKIYFPGSRFDRLRIKLEKRFQFPKYPDDFKFFNQNKIQTFKEYCQDVIQRMTQKNDEINSQSSVEKKRDSSIKPNRISSMLQQQEKSKSIDEIKTNRSTKELQKQANNMIKKNEDKSRNNNKFSHKPKSKKKPLESQKKKEEKKKKSVEEKRSTSLRKKNSFSQSFNGSDHSKKQIDSPLLHKSNISSASLKALSIEEKMSKNKEEIRFKTITENESEGDRYSFVQSEHEQFSQISYKYDRSNTSPPNQRALLSANVAHKKQPSRQIMNQPKKQLRTNHQELRKNENKKEKERTIKNSSPQKYVEKSRQKEAVRKDKKQYPKFNIPIEEMKKKNKNEQKKEKVELDEQENSKSRLSSGRKKFISSEEEMKIDNEQPQQNQQDQKIIQEQRNNFKKIKERPDDGGKNSKDKIKQSKSEDPIENQLVQIKLIQNKEPTKKQEENTFKKVSKPKKIKADKSVKTVFEAMKNEQVNNEIEIPKVELKSSKKIIEEIHQSPKRENLLVEKKIVRTEQNVKSFEKKEVKQQRSLQKRNEKQRKQTKQQKKYNQAQVQVWQPEKQIQVPELGAKILNEEKRKSTPQEQEKIEIEYFKNNKIPESSEQETPRNITHIQDLQHEHKYKNVVNRSRFKKSSQISLAISPVIDNFMPMDSRVNSISNDELRLTLQEQFKDQFDHLRTILVSMQQDSLSSNIQQLRSTLLSEFKAKQQKSSVQFGIQTKNKLRSRSKFHKKKRFMEQSIEGGSNRQENQRLEQQENIQSNKLLKEGGKQKLNNISNQPSRTSSTQEKRGKSLERKSEFEPNTLLYALYQRKALNL